MKSSHIKYYKVLIIVLIIILSIVAFWGVCKILGTIFDSSDNNSQHSSTENSVTQSISSEELTTQENGTTESLDIASSDEPDFDGEQESFDLNEVPDYIGSPYVEINDNVPQFSDEDKNSSSFESYSELDYLGRCGTAYANLSKELMPTEERGEIGSVKPSGWHTVKYPELIDDRYLYNRCHLIAFSLAGENANENNLITGTRYMNMQGMLPFEREVLDYINDTNNHVLYRVTPCFSGEDLVARGVHIEAYSIELQGTGISFNVFVYNVQPGIVIDYSNGDSEVE